VRFADARSGIDLDALHDAPVEVLERLKTIVSNIRESPRDPRFRRLRLNNAILQREVFSHRGSMPFLRSIGFTPSRCDDGGGPVELLLLPEEALNMQRLNEAFHGITEALEQLKQTTVTASESLQRLRHSVTMEIRRDRWQQALDTGCAGQYLSSLFRRDVAGDGMYSAMLSLRTIREVLSNILKNPGDARMRRLRMGNPLVHRAVVSQDGGLELLLHAGFDFDPSSSVPELCMSEGEGNERRVHEALAMLALVEADVQREREAESKRLREEAVKAFLRDREVERHNAAAAQSRSATEDRSLLKPQTNQRAEEETLPPHEQRRVKVEDALRYLLGKD
jgi:hypothetical protein